MIKVALTGNIASGKSTVQDFIENFGYKVLDTDVVGHEILKTSSEIKDAFSNYDVFNQDKTISREKLAQLVFSDKKLKDKLESISHPLIRDKMIEFFEQNSSEKVIFVAIPLLFEANMQDLFDKIIFVYADDEIRKKRLILRNKYSEDYAEIRIKSQMPQDKKVVLCDYVIYNDADVESLHKQIKDVLSFIL